MIILIITASSTMYPSSRIRAKAMNLYSAVFRVCAKTLSPPSRRRLYSVIPITSTRNPACNVTFFLFMLLIYYFIIIKTKLTPDTVFSIFFQDSEGSISL